MKQNAAASDSGATLTITTASAYAVGIQTVVLRGTLPTTGGAIDGYTNNSSTANVTTIANTAATATVDDFEILWSTLNGTDTGVTISTPSDMTAVSAISAPIANCVAGNLSISSTINAGSSTAAHSSSTTNTNPINYTCWSILLKRSA